MPQFSGPKKTEQVVIPEPEPTVTLASTGGTVTPKVTPKPKPKVADVTPAKFVPLALDVTYFVRIMVPVGSELTIRSEGAGRPSVKTIKTDGGPPYAVTLPVDAASGAFPMKITATLSSTIGHVLEGEVTLPKNPGGSVDIVLVPKTDS